MADVCYHPTLSNYLVGPCVALHVFNILTIAIERMELAGGEVKWRWSQVVAGSSCGGVKWWLRQVVELRGGGGKMAEEQVAAELQ